MDGNTEEAQEGIQEQGWHERRIEGDIIKDVVQKGNQVLPSLRSVEPDPPAHPRCDW